MKIFMDFRMIVSGLILIIGALIIITGKVFEAISMSIQHEWWFIVLIYWLWFVAMIILFANNKKKCIIGVVFATLLVWSIALNDVRSAGKETPPVLRIKSPTVTSSCIYTVNP